MNDSHLMRFDILDLFAASGSVFGMVLKNQFGGFSGRNNLKTHISGQLNPKTGHPGDFSTVKNTARGCKKV